VQLARHNYYIETFESVREKFEQITHERVVLERQNKESLGIIQAYKAAQVQQMKKVETDIHSVEENIKQVKISINTLARPKTPPKIEIMRPATPPPPPPQPVVDLGPVFEKIEAVRADCTKLMVEEKIRTLEFVKEKVKSIESQTQRTKNFADSAIEELKDKLAWLPISLSQLEGMAPNEARLFTIEARLRSEENSRIQAYNHIMQMIDKQSARPTPELEVERRVVSPVAEKLVSARSLERKRMTGPAGGVLRNEWWRKTQEGERKNWSEEGSVVGGRFKFSTPLPGEEGEVLGLYRDKRKGRAVPRSWDVEIMQIPRIQTAAPNKVGRILGNTGKGS
jgi:hypothetical protein